MSNWNQDMTSAPRGRTVQTQRLVADKNSASGQSLRVVNEFIRDDVILNTKCSKALKSYWIPDEQRWAGLSKAEEPIAWQPWPTPLQLDEDAA
jgi:hypothetical protein